MLKNKGGKKERRKGREKELKDRYKIFVLRNRKLEHLYYI